MFAVPTPSPTDRLLPGIACFGKAMTPEVRARRVDRPSAGGG